MAAGSYDPSHAHAEVLDIKTGNWTVVADYPFKGDGNRLSNYPMVYIPDMSAYFVIGGSAQTTVLKTIAKFKNRVWSDAGRLSQGHKVSSCS